MGLLILLVAGCASTDTIVETTVAASPVQWPQAQASVSFVRSYSKFIVEKRSFWEKLAGVISGQRDAQNGLVKPVAVAVAPDGTIAIADPPNGIVHVYHPEQKRYVRITTAGKSGDLISPVGVAFDTKRRLFVSDSVRREVCVFDHAGEHLFSIRDADERRLVRPTGLAFNRTNDRLYVSDTGAHRIHIFDAGGRFISSFGDRGVSEGKFNFPTYLFSDGEGLIYVVDAMNFRVQIFTATGAFIGMFGHHGDGSGDFSMPKGIAVDRWGVIYVVDSLFDSVQLFDRDGSLLLTVGHRGTEIGEFWLPSGCFIDDRDLLYVCDTYNRRIQVFKIYGDRLQRGNRVLGLYRELDLADLEIAAGDPSPDIDSGAERR